MRPKIALLISTALTAFVVTVAYGLVTRINANTQAAALAPQAAAAAPIDLPAAQPAVQSPLTPDQAVGLAAAAINRQDVYSVELVSYQGFQSYKVVFSSGDIVYIGMNSQFLDRTSLQATTTATAQPSISVQTNTLQNNFNLGSRAAVVHESDGHETESEGN